MSSVLSVIRRMYQASPVGLFLAVAFLLAAIADRGTRAMYGDLLMGAFLLWVAYSNRAKS